MEEIVAGVYLPVTGELKGAALLAFPRDTAFSLCDALLKKPPGQIRKLSWIDKAALKESGNIITGKYLAAFSNILKIKIIEHIPNFSFTMFGAMLEQVINAFAKEAREALIIEVQFIFQPKELKGYFLLLFKIEDMKKIGGGI